MSAMMQEFMGKAIDKRKITKKVIKLKKFMDVRLNTIERNLQGDKAIEYLEYLNSTLFVFEYKTQFQHEDVRGYYRNLLENEYYLSKFKRNLKYFTEEKSGQESLNKKFRTKIPGFDVNCMKVVPIFVSNISYPFVKQDNIYVLDVVRLYNYLKKQSPLIHYIDNINKRYYCINQLPLKLFAGNITDSNFVYYLEHCKEYEIDIEQFLREVEIPLDKYGIYAIRLIYDKDYFEDIIKKYVETNSNPE